MELQQRNVASVNVYESSHEQEKTEDLYQCLQNPAATPERSSGNRLSNVGQKILVLLFTIIVILLAIILLLNGMHYYHTKQIGAETMKYQSSNKEIWYLHDETFYLFWSNQGKCESAKGFCAERKANLATVTTYNKDWLQLQINGKHMLVQNDQLKGTSGYSSGEMLPAHDDDDDDDDDEDSSDCEVFGGTSDTRTSEGWVCEKGCLCK